MVFKITIYAIGYINLDYTFDDNSQKCKNALKKIDAWEILKKCKKIWYINRVAKTKSSRKIGGAASAYERKPTKITYRLPYYLRSNLQLPVIKMKESKETLIFLPDRLMLVHKSRVGAVKYEDILFDIYAVGEICNEPPADDSKFSREVWLYANKDGSPDMRHKDNKQLPVYEIGRIDITSPNGLDIRLAISNTDILEQFQKEFTNSKLQVLYNNILNRVAEGRAPIRSETFEERMVLMVSWNDIFTFVLMLVAILAYIDNRKHKK